jgi:hypothetical protein
MDTAPPVETVKLCRHNAMKIAHAMADLKNAVRMRAWAKRPERVREAQARLEAAQAKLANNREQLAKQPACGTCLNRPAAEIVAPEDIPPTDRQLDMLSGLPEDGTPTEPAVLGAGKLASARPLVKRGFLILEDAGRVHRRRGNYAQTWTLAITPAGLEMLRRCRG